MQKLLDNKAMQLQRAESMLEKLKEDLAGTQRQAGVEIQRLVAELRDATESNQGHLLSAIDAVSQRPQLNGYRGNLDSALNEKEDKIEVI